MTDDVVRAVSPGMGRALHSFRACFRSECEGAPGGGRRGGPALLLLALRATESGTWTCNVPFARTSGITCASRPEHCLPLTGGIEAEDYSLGDGLHVLPFFCQGKVLRP